MAHFKLIPLYNALHAVEFLAPTAAEALRVANQHKFEEAHLYEDGDYLFTLRQSRNGAGCWVIHTQPELATAAAVSAYQ
jgi:hypothetical protein